MYKAECCRQLEIAQLATYIHNTTQTIQDLSMLDDKVATEWPLILAVLLPTTVVVEVAALTLLASVRLCRPKAAKVAAAVDHLMTINILRLQL
jgi:hypothetical protein